MRKIETNEYAYSYDGSLYHGPFDSEDEAINEFVADCTLNKGYVGKCTRVEFEESDCSGFACMIIEGLDEVLSDVVGEASDAWVYEITPNQEQELDKGIAKVVLEWIKENYFQPTSYLIESWTDFDVSDLRV
jgi:hypothetical protein